MEHMMILMKVFLDKLNVIVKQIDSFYRFFNTPFLTISPYSVSSILTCFCMYNQFRCLRVFFLSLRYMHIACKYAYLKIIRSRPVCECVVSCRSFIKFYGLDLMVLGGWVVLVCYAFLTWSGNSAVLLVYISFFLNGNEGFRSSLVVV